MNGVDSIVSVDGLVKRHGETVAVRHVSYEVERGELFGLIGPNGSGKTMTAECLQGPEGARSRRTPASWIGPGHPG